MTIVGGFDVHRQQITFDYVDNDGLVRWGQIRPATRKTLRSWLAEHCPDGDGGVRAGGLHRVAVCRRRVGGRGRRCASGGSGRDRGIAGAARSAPRPTAPMRGCCARCCWRAGSRSRGSRRRTCWRSARLGRLYCTLMDERRAWQQRIHAQLFHQGCPPIRALLSAAGRDALAPVPICRPAGRQYVDTALRRIDELSVEIEPLRTQLIDFARRQPGCQALQAPLRHRLAVRGDHLGRDRRCAPVLQL